MSPCHETECTGSLTVDSGAMRQRGPQRHVYRLPCTVGEGMGNLLAGNGLSPGTLGVLKPLSGVWKGAPRPRNHPGGKNAHSLCRPPSPHPVPAMSLGHHGTPSALSWCWVAFLCQNCSCDQFGQDRTKSSVFNSELRPRLSQGTGWEADTWRGAESCEVKPESTR